MPALAELIDQLAAYEPTDSPVVSLYLNLQPDQHGRDNYDAFVRKELRERLKSYEARSPERTSLEKDVQRIRAYLDNTLDRSANGLALFACDASGLFEAVQLEVPVDEHRLYIDREPHLYPLARLDDQYPRYAALLLDTNSARLFVFSAGAVERTETVQNVKTRRTDVGGWSQARYQRHVENFHLQHVKEVVDMLERVVRAERIPHVILSGEQVVVPLVREQLSSDIAERVIDIARFDVGSSERDVVERTLEALRERDAEDDRERVARLLDTYRSGGLAVIGPEDTRRALENGQVDELLVSATLDRPAAAPGADMAASAEAGAADPARAERMGEELVTKAAQTAAGVTFIEDPALLAEVGGVGALLRFKIAGHAS